MTPAEVIDVSWAYRILALSRSLLERWPPGLPVEFYPVRVAGGVSANSRLREEWKADGDAREMPTFLPSPRLPTDNAAMIAAAGLRKFRAGVSAGFDLNADAGLPL